MPDRRAAAAAEMFELRCAFGGAIRGRREAADLSVARFAKRCRLSKSTVNKIEQGHGGEPGLSVILIFCEVFEITPSTLLDGLLAPREPLGSMTGIWSVIAQSSWRIREVGSRHDHAQSHPCTAIKAGRALARVSQ